MTGDDKPGVRIVHDGENEYWTGWAAKIPPKLAFECSNLIFKLDGLARFAFRNRWLLNGKRPGARRLDIGLGQVITMKPAQTLTHYAARTCLRLLRSAKKAAIDGRRTQLELRLAQSETEAERLYSHWLHSFAARESKRVNGIREGWQVQSAMGNREHVKRILDSLPLAQRYARGVTQIVCKRTGLSPNQARSHIQALGYGSKNKGKIKRNA